jgi:hypothetical protein
MTDAAAAMQRRKSGAVIEVLADETYTDFATL